MLIISSILAVVFMAAMFLYETYAANIRLGVDFLLIELMMITFINFLCMLVTFFYVKHENKPVVKKKNTVNARYARTEKTVKPRKAYAITAIVIGAVCTVSSIIMIAKETEALAYLGLIMMIFGLPSVLLLLLIDYVAGKANV